MSEIIQLSTGHHSKGLHIFHFNISLIYLVSISYGWLQIFFYISLEACVGLAMPSILREVLVCHSYWMLLVLTFEKVFLFTVLCISSLILCLFAAMDPGEHRLDMKLDYLILSGSALKLRNQQFFVCVSFCSNGYQCKKNIDYTQLHNMVSLLKKILNW